MKTADMARFLDVQAVTVRKYATALEKAGYLFERIDGKNREYNEQDVTIMKELTTLCNRSGLGVEKAAFVVVTRFKERLTDDTEKSFPAVLTPEERRIERYGDALQIIQTISEQNAALIEHMNHQDEEIARLHKRMDEQNHNLSAILRESLEAKRMIAATQERKWWNFFRRSPDKPDQGERDPETEWNRKKQRERDIYTPGRG
ncbi:DUF3967 domain-containing protein [Paenibacillus polymyxa]|uniref:DUF3967 domain-containing protein n=1 Tax=Paenibacillus polymyxa TaxID=1406 RepID=UPI002ED22BA3|nr:DUF3967 domain-containing protein [Paenibacillus polymyxa]